MKNIKRLFVPPSIEEMRKKELYEAQRQLMEFEAAVEYHTAMRDMMRLRIERLEKE